MKCADAIIEILKREGVSTLFCFPTTSLIENAVAAGIRPIICRQERVGVDMADGFARVTNGKPPGVFMMQYGPGSENAFPGIATTFSDSVPVLFLPLAHARDQSQVFPTFRSNRTYASITKQVEEIVVPESTTAVMRRAFNALRNGRPGPVMVEVPRDIVGLEAGDDAASYRPIVPHYISAKPSGCGRSSKTFACRIASHDPRGTRRAVRRGIRGAHGTRRPPADAGHDDGGRKKRLPRGSSFGSRVGWQHVQWARPPIPAYESRPDIRDRLWLHQTPADDSNFASERPDHPCHE